MPGWNRATKTAADEQWGRDHARLVKFWKTHVTVVVLGVMFVAWLALTAPHGQPAAHPTARPATAPRPAASHPGGLELHWPLFLVVVLLVSVVVAVVFWRVVAGPSLSDAQAFLDDVDAEQEELRGRYVPDAVDDEDEAS